jgi:hypothetical protein
MRNFQVTRRIVRVMARLRAQLSYANVMATVAVFVALGGTSYAVATLPRNSVGPKQIRSNAVGSSELRSRSVRSTEVRDRSLRLRDLSRAARESLRGRPGPPGPHGPIGQSAASFTAAVNAGGRVESTKGGATGSHTIGGSGEYTVTFNRDMRACWAVGSISRVPGAPPEHPDEGEIVTSTTGSGVFVRTRNHDGNPADLPFHLIVVC